MAPAPAVDLVRLPLLGRFLRWRGARPALQMPLLLLAIAMVWHGLAGPQLAPKNLATTLSWVHYRSILVISLLIAGNVFCAACPFMLVRQVARRFVRPRFTWPQRLRTKWLSLALLILILYSYELFRLWSSPRLTAWLILAYFAGAVAVDSLFKHATFCKFLCPIGQFNFVASAISPLEVAVRDPDVCSGCRTKDCIRGRRTTVAAGGPRRGCEMALFQPLKSGNMDCTFCLDCIHACPHDNIGIVSRRPGEEMVYDRRRSGIGRFSRRPDLAALSIVFTFGALINALGMIGPVYTLEAWLARTLHLPQRAPILGLLFVAVLIVAPLLLITPTCLLTQRLTGMRSTPLTDIARRYAHCLVPLGFSIWLAHYSYHLLTGLWTFVPVAQSALSDLGIFLPGPVRWDLGGISPAAATSIEQFLIGCGLLGSLQTAWRIAESVHGAAKRRAVLPWAVLCLLLWSAALWLLSQPMDMRGTFLGNGN